MKERVKKNGKSFHVFKSRKRPCDEFKKLKNKYCLACFAKKLKPDVYEAFLLEAEIKMKEGNFDTAKPILLSLSSDLNAPAWVRVMADTFLKTME